jgi:hypothetical protein
MKCAKITLAFKDVYYDVHVERAVAFPVYFRTNLSKRYAIIKFDSGN